ncbi:MAG: type I methionyl aminopeptidase [Candidatus Peribacteraceae bacterium]|jgi:methionyl aminopeptidase|nr:type I methionyl aminopeptidase [bacterium]MDP6561668.1 type I methionyl aminopeptidase [Candidatus Peribacteraceae bacterium]|tara:strand:- start:130 stop:879 length:750 start_codon:yes stop_codon:yes gene_type:complete
MSSFQIFTPKEITSLRHAGKILAECLELMGSLVAPGITTKELDRAAEEFIRKHDGATPAFMGYHGYPATLCTSVNEQCVHGLPGDRVLEEGDIISTDCGVLYNDLFTDACRTYGVGNISKDAKHLLTVTEQALKDAVGVIKAGTKVGDISATVQGTVEGAGLSIVSALTGHGLGKTLHQFPDVPNYGEKGTGPKLPANTIIAVEPIVCTGKDGIKEADDNWTITTKDGSLSAHFEHTLLILEDGCEVIA